MNVWEAYEELKSSLGPEASQKVAMVLDALMQEHVRTSVREALDPVQRTLQQLAEEQVRTERLFQQVDQQLAELGVAQNRTEALVREVAEARRETEARFRELVEAQKRTEVRLEELAGAQKRTEARLEELTVRVGELAEAEKRTEARLETLALRVEELAEAQKRTETRLEELAEAERRTELRLGELAEAQKRTEVRLEELAEAQRHTEARLDETNRQLGGLAMTLGYTLENRAYQALPPLLEREHGVRLVERLRRGFLTDAEGSALEVNILGRAERGGQPIWVVGECKAQLSCNDVDRFLRRRVKRLEPVLGRVFPVMVAHMISAPDVLEYAQGEGVAVYLSFQFEG